MQKLDKAKKPDRYGNFKRRHNFSFLKRSPSITKLKARSKMLNSSSGNLKNYKN